MHVMINTAEVAKRITQASDKGALGDELATILFEEQERTVELLATKDDLVGLKNELKSDFSLKFNTIESKITHLEYKIELYGKLIFAGLIVGQFKNIFL